MVEIVSVGESIEGRVVDGSSRKPLSYRGLSRYGNIVCHRFLSEFNVRAHIVEPLESADKRFDDKAKSCRHDKLICDVAIIHSLKDKFSSSLGSNISATHGASLWHFPQQTNVKITRSHAEIENAIQKKLRKENP